MQQGAWRVATGLVLALVFGAGCFGGPLRDYGQEPQPSYVPVTAFDEGVTAKLTDLGPMARVKKQAVAGDISLHKAVATVNDAWRTYLNRLHDGRLAQHPVLMKSKELSGNSYADICWQAHNQRFPQPVFPLNCVDAASGGERTALVVWPEGFTTKVREFARTHSNREGWLLAGLLAGEAYASHVRTEMRGLKFTWPDGRPFNYCMAGMSLRAMFPADLDEWLETHLSAVLEALDQLVSPPDDPDARLTMLATGYTAGKLDACLP